MADETAPDPTAAAAADERIPARLGDFEVRGLLGRGGMGRVFRAYDQALDREVAIKELLPSLASRPDLVQRFLREARLMGRLLHENICAVHHMGQDPASGAPFFVMEYVDGETVARLLERDGPLPVERALRVARATAVALRAALGQNLVHRDVKPSNVMLSTAGVVKVTDFGLVKMLEDASPITTSGAYLGTAQYVSPEGGKGQPCDHRSDIYSLGATLFHLLTGRVPFAGPSPLAMVYHHCYEPLPDMLALRPGLSKGVVRLVERMMAKAPGARHQTYDELLADLDALLAAETAAAASAASGPAPLRVLALLAAAVALGAAAWTWRIPGPPTEVVRVQPAPEVVVAAPPVATPVPEAMPLPVAVEPTGAATAPVVAAVTLLRNSVGMALAWLPPGQFLMGSPEGEPDRRSHERQHLVTIPQALWMATGELTWKHYRSLMKAEPGQVRLPPGVAEPPSDDFPLGHLSWDDAQTFARVLTQYEQAAGLLGDDLRYRLPTEAEWEYGCRAGTSTAYSFGAVLPSTAAAFRGREVPGGARPDEFAEQPVPLEAFPPNPFRLRQMHGNLAEWCWDWFAPYPSGPSLDCGGPTSGAYRVLRGGSFVSDEAACRSAARERESPGATSEQYGARLVLASWSPGWLPPPPDPLPAEPTVPVTLSLTLTKSPLARVKLELVSIDGTAWTTPQALPAAVGGELRSYEVSRRLSPGRHALVFYGELEPREKFGRDGFIRVRTFVAAPASGPCRLDLGPVP